MGGLTHALLYLLIADMMLVPLAGIIGYTLGFRADFRHRTRAIRRMTTAVNRVGDGREVPLDTETETPQDRDARTIHRLEHSFVQTLDDGTMPNRSHGST